VDAGDRRVEGRAIEQKGMRKGESPLERTGRLARRVINGVVVLLVGAGFSRDSEGNSAERLVGRLLAGLLSMGTVLVAEAGDQPSQAKELLDGLVQVFGLQAASPPRDVLHKPAQWMTETNIKLLAREYYNFNEWSVSAFGVLSGELIDLRGACPEARRDDVARRIEQLGSFFLTLVNDSVPLDPLDWRALKGFDNDDAARGKAVFLDTMGFANEQIMGGTPLEVDLRRLETSYLGRLRPRHHALARLAREGLAPTLVTTNYDLLLEGAYRLAGFLDRESASAAAEDLPRTGMPRFSRIAGADDFFAHGQGYRTALLLKIHGCAGAYRAARREQLSPTPISAGAHAPPARSGNVWASYLPALVFTYREIQTWRADAWSRDLIRTLLRTNTLALCGYSGADPVVHSTFRDVYEEMGRSRVARGAGSIHGESENAPVFFFGIADRREFHSFEILRAATAAGGFRARKLVEHPNHIEFKLGASFPTVDDHFRWLTHRVLRDRQQEALAARLRGLAPRLLGHPCPEVDFVAMCDAFTNLCEAECQTIARASDASVDFRDSDRRRIFDSIVGWSWHFVPGLLRELALAELAQSRQGPGRTVGAKRASPWYFPVSERPEWAAWGAVVELALRNMVAARRDKPAESAGVDFEWLSFSAEESPYAALSFTCDEGQYQPRALCIRLQGFRRPDSAPALRGAFRRVTYWDLGEQDVPWCENRVGLCPSASDVWRWAVGQSTDRECASYHLGVSP
jgi:hypothetical protein